MLFTPLQLGRIELANRIVMSPMTRSRALDNVPTERIARYYALRASAGLLVTEGTAPSANGLGYARIPGIYSPAQIAGWRLVTDAVHAAGGRIFIQVMHTGRTSHPANMPAGARILAPSAIAQAGAIHTDTSGQQPYPVPAEMTTAEIAAAVDEFAHAARAAIEAGADGIELHGANGYLIEQFLNPASNQRGDAYGGSPSHRMRFALEVAEATASAIGGDRIGFRISPSGAGPNGMALDADTDPLFLGLARELTERRLAYLHVADFASMAGAPPVPPTLLASLHTNFRGALMLSGGYDRARAETDLAAGHGDLIAFGRPFLANPSLVAQLRDNQPLLAPDPATFFSPDDAGFLDWPIYEARA